MTEKRKLRMTVAGRFIDLLGHQMYGGPVQAVAEFVANAWDADSTKVEVSVSEDPREEGAEIRVRDYGEGMNFQELIDWYLTIGYERRKERGERTDSGRLVMGRKGIGKLAGFGIAEDIVLRTVKAGWAVQFTLNYTELKSRAELGKFEFEPEIDEASDEDNGVTVILKNLKLERKINIESFRRSISRRFALNTEIMDIVVNDESITKEDLDLECRIPIEDGLWGEENIEGFGEVSYWFGFLNDTIKDSELRGVSVFARDRIAQITPFFFNLTGGINGQVGLEYLTGQVKADTLDDTVDYIATPRQTVNWQFGNAQVLEKWGQEKIKELCSDWKKRREKKNLEKFKHDYSELYPRIYALAEQERKDLMAALERIAGLERVGEAEFRVIANSLINGVERESVKKVIMRINATTAGALPELIEAIREWDIISAVSLAEVMSGRLEIIRQFKEHIDNRLREKSPEGHVDMQGFVMDYPWLLGQKYGDLKPADFDKERGVDKWIEEKLQEVNREYETVDGRDGRRFDLLCIKNDFLILILELMRPGLPLDYDHVMRLNRYVTRIQAHVQEFGLEYADKKVFGMLIADYPMKDTSVAMTVQDLRHNLEVYPWNALFNLVQEGYRDYIEVLRMKAPEDPRIKGLVNFG
ncbi:MAG TPA: hypothetical protein G4N93_00010 [Dehalococcoidia bacterium]|nr:hypothetical protein [Dehalococcoidia bacterium]